MNDRRSIPIRAVLVLVGFIVSCFFLLGWFSEEMETTIDLGAAEEVLIITDAGPVDLFPSTTDQVEIVLKDSWLFSKPKFESNAIDGRAVIRISCTGRFPCRSAARISVPADASVVVVTVDSLASVTALEGNLTVLADGGETVLGLLSGSARVVSRRGAVEGISLRVDQLEVSSDVATVTLDHAVAPDSLVVTGSARSIDVVLPEDSYVINAESASSTVSLEFESSLGASKAVVLEGRGQVRVQKREPAEETPDD